MLFIAISFTSLISILLIWLGYLQLKKRKTIKAGISASVAMIGIMMWFNQVITMMLILTIWVLIAVQIWKVIYDQILKKQQEDPFVKFIQN